MSSYVIISSRFLGWFWGFLCWTFSVGRCRKGVICSCSGLQVFDIHWYYQDGICYIWILCGCACFTKKWATSGRWMSSEDTLVESWQICVFKMRDVQTGLGWWTQNFQNPKKTSLAIAYLKIFKIQAPGTSHESSQLDKITHPGGIPTHYSSQARIINDLYSFFLWDWVPYESELSTTASRILSDGWLRFH